MLKGVWLASILFICHSALATSQAVDVADTKVRQINHAVSAFDGSVNQLAIHELLPFQNSLTAQPHSSANLGNQYQIQWLVMTLNNQSINQVTSVVFLDNPTLDVIDFYLVDSQNQVVKTALLGQRKHLKPYFLNGFAHIKVTLGAYENYRLYMRVKTFGLPHVPLYLYTPDAFDDLVQERLMFWGFFAGSMALIGLFSLVVCFVNRDLASGFYAGYLWSVALSLTTGLGFAYYYVPSGFVTTFIDQQTVFRFMVLSLGLFTTIFYVLDGKSPKKSQPIGFTIACVIACFGLASMILPHTMTFRILVLAQLAFYGYFVWIFIQYANTKMVWLKAHLLGWLPVYAAGSLIPLSLAGIIEYDNATRMFLAWALLLQAIANVVSFTLKYRAKELSFHHQSNHDNQSGLPNAFCFDRIMADYIKTPVTFTLMLIEPSRMLRAHIHFGLQHNARYSQLMGQKLNELLSQYAALNIEKQDTGGQWHCARVGDALYACMLAGDVDDATLNKCARDMANLFATKTDINGILVSSQIVIGVAKYPAHAKDVEALNQNALYALNDAKLRRSLYSEFNETIHQSLKQNLTIMSSLRSALERDEFRLLLQPKIDLKTRKAVGAEVLIRWQHPTLGIIKPSEFIHVAESASLINDITYWVLERALIYQSMLVKHHPGHQIAMNVSSKDIHNPLFIRALSDQVESRNLTFKDITLELDESIIEQDVAQLRAAISRIKSMGCRVSLDNFGVGALSLSHLSLMDFDEIKIGQSSELNLAQNPVALMITKTLCQMAKSLGVDVVIDGIETQDVARHLTDFQCDYGQGYYFARAMNFEDYLDWLKTYDSVFVVSTPDLKTRNS